MRAPRLHWSRGRAEIGPGDCARTLEWIGRDDAGEPIARVIRLPAPQGRGGFTSGASDDAAQVVELRAAPPVGADWLACLGGRVVGRAPLPLQAVRTVEAALDRQ